MTEPAILAEGLRKTFESVRALDGADLRAEAGTVLGLLGPNGAGKTTTVRILTTLLKPDGGRATVAGLDVVARANALRALLTRVRGHAAFASDSLVLAKAQSSHCVRASTSWASTVAPHQTRRPGGASR